MSVYRYDRVWDSPAGAPPLTDLDIELQCFRWGYDEGFDKVAHFWNIVEMLWGEGCPVKFVRTPWAEEMTEAACKHDYVAITGCGSSGKSEWAGVWAVINWLCAPKETLVLCTSTTMQEGRKRIWSKVRKYYQAVPGLPGKLIEHPSPQIKLPECDDTTGITLLPGQPSKAREAVSKLIGLKQERIIFVADELSELSEAILEAAFTNLTLNDHFQLIGLSNAKSYFDPFGILATPKFGWASINVEMSSWETERGIALHFDGEKSPNFDHPTDIYPIYGRKQMLDHKKLGLNSPGYWRQCRGFWCPSGNSAKIYTEADLLKHKVDRKVEHWFNPPVKIAGFDPSFTTDGDRCIIYFGLVGEEIETGRTIVQLDGYEELHADVTKKDDPINYQFARQFRDLCTQRGVQAFHAGLDSTNIPFADIVSELWSREVLRVPFGGAASEMMVSDFTNKPASELYANRVTEIWFGGKRLLDGDQMCNVPPELAREMCEREYETVKRGPHTVSLAESKTQMKRRAGRSPDIADACFVMLQVARERLKLYGGYRGSETSMDDWKNLSNKYDVFSTSLMHKYSPTVDKKSSPSNILAS
jgi:hypothetical protein